MKNLKKHTSFALALLLAGVINLSSTYVQAAEINPSAKIVKLASSESLTATNVIDFAKKFIGTPYKTGGTTTSGFDCSGFTTYVYNHFNISLPRTAAGQASKGVVVSKDHLQAGDLVFFGKPINHVGIYIGDGNFIHATKPGHPLAIEQLKYMSNYTTARRIITQ